MLKSIRERGFKDGYEAAIRAKKQGTSIKRILSSFQADDKEVAKKLMEELKDYNVRWYKCFSLAVVYSFGYDAGVSEAVYFG